MTEYKISATGMGDKDTKWTKIKNIISKLIQSDDDFK